MAYKEVCSEVKSDSEWKLTCCLAVEPSKVAGHHRSISTLASSSCLTVAPRRYHNSRYEVHNHADALQVCLKREAAALVRNTVAYIVQSKA